jgi:hypothetical protein
MTVVGTDVYMVCGQEPSAGVCFNDVLGTDLWVWSAVEPAGDKPQTTLALCWAAGPGSVYWSEHAKPMGACMHSLNLVILLMQYYHTIAIPKLED